MSVKFILTLAWALVLACGRSSLSSKSSQEILLEESSSIIDGYLVSKYRATLSDRSMSIVSYSEFTIKTNIEGCDAKIFLNDTELSSTHSNNPIQEISPAKSLWLYTITLLNQSCFSSIPVVIFSPLKAY